MGRPAAAAAAAAADLAGRAAARAGAAGAARAARSARVGLADGARRRGRRPSARSAPSAPAPPADALWPATAVEDPPAWEGDGGSARRAARSDSDFVVPEGLVDVERRSNCSLDAIIAVLSQSPTFRRELGDGAEAAAAQSDALRYLGDAFRASAEGSDAGVDAAVDGLRTALAARSNDEAGEGVRSELATGGAHLDVAEVLGEVVAVLGTAKRCRSAALALRTRGHIHQQACRKCGHRNADFRDDVAFDELARSAPAAALVHAARSDGGSVADVFRDAHAHAAKSCDACRAPGACEVDVVLEHAAKALVLSLAWYSTDQEGDDVAALLELRRRRPRVGEPGGAGAACSRRSARSSSRWTSSRWRCSRTRTTRRPGRARDGSRTRRRGAADRPTRAVACYGDHDVFERRRCRCRDGPMLPGPALAGLRPWTGAGERRRRPAPPLVNPF